MDAMNIGELTAAGFPVAVATYLLIRLERELRMLRRTIEQCWCCPTCRNVIRQIEQEEHLAFRRENKS